MAVAIMGLIAEYRAMLLCSSFMPWMWVALPAYMGRFPGPRLSHHRHDVSGFTCAPYAVLQQEYSDEGLPVRSHVKGWQPIWHTALSLLGYKARSDSSMKIACSVCRLKS